MAIFLNGGANPTRVVFNGNGNIGRVIFRHNNVDTVVWQKEITVTGPTNPYFDGWTVLWHGSGFSSDTTDYQLNFSSNLASNPLTLDKIEFNSMNVTSTTWSGSVTITIDLGEEGTATRTVNYSDILPSMNVIMQGDLFTPCPSGFHLVRTADSMLTGWFNLNGCIPSVLNVQTYTVNLADSYGHGYIYINSSENVGYTNFESGTITDVNDSGRPTYSTFCWIAPTGTVKSYIDAYIARQGWTGAQYTVTSMPSAEVTTDTTAFRLKFHDSNNTVWYSDWITGLGWAQAAFTIKPAY